MPVKITKGKDGRKYYFYKGKRISTKKADELLKKSHRKSLKKTDKCDGIKCDNSKICNPASGRCVNKTGKIGKTLLGASRRKSLKKTDKCDGIKCDSSKICNPASGRCVKKTGKIGKTLLGASRIKSKRTSSKKKSKRTSSKKKSKKKSKTKGDNCDGVKCPSTRICLEATGKCVKPCLPHQIRDPISRRCRNRSGYKRERAGSGKYKPCPSHQERDPVTHRCKNKPGFKRERHAKTKPRPSYSRKSRWKDTKKDERDCVKRSNLPLRSHQKKVVRYMRNNRSLLVVHCTGTGKTLSAVTVSQCYLDENPKNNIVFIGPVSLKSNFIKELRGYGLKNIDIARKYRFYSYAKFLNATKNRVLNQVATKKLRTKMSWPINPIPLKNSLLIIDEAHNARNPTSSTSRALVATSFTADKVLLLTATPFVNSIRDFIPLINMLHGRYVVGTIGEYRKGDVSNYLGTSTKEANLNVFRYFLQDYVDVVDQRDKRYFPKRIDHMVYVNMTPAYLKRYERLLGRGKVADLYFSHPKHFYNGYRRAVNKAGPEYYSSKVTKAIPILKKGKALIYSNWRKFGVAPIAASLKAAGITFRTFTGSTKISDRQAIIDAFNNDEFQVLVVTKAGGEGLDLKGVRSVVVLDPVWNDAGLQQLIGRAVRYKSHDHLPAKFRVVHVYMMVLIAPGLKKREITNPDGSPKKGLRPGEVIQSGDLILYDIIRRKRKIEELLLKVLKELSIEWDHHESISEVVDKHIGELGIARLIQTFHGTGNRFPPDVVHVDLRTS